MRLNCATGTLAQYCSGTDLQAVLWRLVHRRDAVVRVQRRRQRRPQPHQQLVRVTQRRGAEVRRGAVIAQRRPHPPACRRPTGCWLYPCLCFRCPRQRQHHNMSGPLTGQVKGPEVSKCDSCSKILTTRAAAPAAWLR